MHYYKFNIADWHLATSHLTFEEELVYFKLCNFYYDSEQPISAETQMVTRRLRLGNRQEIVDAILLEYFDLCDDGWRHKRCDLEIFAYQEKLERNRAVGKLGGRPKKTQMVSKANPNITLTTNHKPLTTNQYKTNAPNGFDEFWIAYNKKIGKPNAIKQWQKIKPSEELAKVIVAKALADCAAKPDTKFRKDPERWLKGRHWEDEIIVAAPSEQALLPLGSDQQIEAAYRIECGGDPTQSRFASYHEMRRYVLEHRDKHRTAA